MFTSTFRAPSLPVPVPVPLPQTVNHNSNYPYIMDHHHYDDDQYLNIPDLDFSDYLSSVIDQPDQDNSSSSNFNFNSSSLSDPIPKDMATNSTESLDSSINVCMPRTTTPMQLEADDESKRINTVHGGLRIAFRMKTELEIVDDGYKWRKYGKKKVKSSPNHRNYYKCSSGGCIVKKRVERDRDDWSYVITTYEGVHNHESPSLVHCNTNLLTNGGWTSRS